MVTLEGGHKALVKPQWYARIHYRYARLIARFIVYRYNRSAVMEGAVYSGADRHNGEIAAFYLSLLLGSGMRRTPLAVGRMINLTSEILPVADPELKATFHRNGTCIRRFFSE